jgi:hypothetical protein
LKATVAHLTQEHKLLLTDSVTSWAQTRWPDFVEICQYVIDELIPRFGRWCAFFDRIFAPEDAIFEFHAFAPVEALPCV